MLYLHAGSPFRGELEPWIAKDSLGRSFMVDEFDMSLLDTDPHGEHRWGELVQDFQAGRYNLVLLCPPAASFNRAAFATSSGPAPVRDARWPEGYPWLQGRQKLKAQRGIQHIRRALELVQSADSLHVPWLWEHPEHLGATARGTPASVWTWPETQKFFLQSQANTVVLAQCAYGGPSRSPTRFTGIWAGLGSLGHPGWPRLDKEGCYRGPLPRHCGHDHSASLPLPGYPASLCQALARLAWATVDSSPASSVGGSSFQRGREGHLGRMHWQLLLARCHRRTQRRWQLLCMCRRSNKPWISLRCCLRTILLEGNYKQAPKHSLWAHMLWVEACLEFERPRGPTPRWPSFFAASWSLLSKVLSSWPWLFSVTSGPCRIETWGTNRGLATWSPGSVVFGLAVFGFLRSPGRFLVLSKGFLNAGTCSRFRAPLQSLTLGICTAQWNGRAHGWYSWPIALSWGSAWLMLIWISLCLWASGHQVTRSGLFYG